MSDRAPYSGIGLALLCGVFLLFMALRGCDGGRPRPADLVEEDAGERARLSRRRMLDRRERALAAAVDTYQPADARLDDLADFAAVLERLEALRRPRARRRGASTPQAAPAAGVPRPATAQAGAEEPGGSVALVVGFMGTGDGMTRRQTAAVLALLQELGAGEAHHGDSKGADVQFHGLCLALGLATVLHPPEDEANRGRCQAQRTEPALPYRERNHRIVDATQLLIMAPRQQSGEAVRSGTWETVRYARGLGRRVFIVRPDGSRQEENGPASPDFERFFLDGRAADGRLRPGIAGAACRNVRTALRLLGHALEEGGCGIGSCEGVGGLIAALQTYQEDQEALAGPAEPVIKESQCER
jgi:hypothetical protein